MEGQLIRITAITETDGQGQRCTAVGLELNFQIDETSLGPEYFQVPGRQVKVVRTGSSLMGRDRCAKGRFVILELNTDQEAGVLREMTGQGPHGRSIFHRAKVQVKIVQTIEGEGGSIAPTEGFLESLDTMDEMLDRFTLTSHRNTAGRELYYHQFLPEHYDSDRQYPLVIFLHDAGACSDDQIAPLAQGNGGLVWADPSQEGYEEAIVIAPWYPSVCANDEFQVTQEAEDTVLLIEYLKEHLSVDPGRIYGTGQSMGCMMLCEMNIQYPQLFTACLLVAGQWNPKTMGNCSHSRFWIMVSQGDAKAFPIMGACVDAMEAAGAKVERMAVDAQNCEGELALLSDVTKANILFTWFEGRSLIPEWLEENPGLHHVMTWEKTYSIKPLRQWLLKQRK